MNHRTMLCLPPLVQGAGCWRLPLCDATAMELANALVEPYGTPRAANLAAILTSDPALAVWTVCHWASNRPTEVQTAFERTSLEEIADWLSPRLAELLDWSTCEPVMNLSSDRHGRFAALVAESVGAARKATGSSGTEESTRSSVYFATLIARWNDWFEVARTAEAPADVIPPPSPLASTSTVASGGADGSDISDNAWRRWLTEMPGTQSLLPALVARLREVAQLQANFQSQLQHAKLESLKEFAYGAGHELNNPLANIASRAQTLLGEETNPERRRRLAAINTQAFRAHEMLADLMLFARPPKLKLEQIDLVQLADDVLSELTVEAALQQTTLHRPNRRDPLSIAADAMQLRVALRALCVNSLEAIGRNGNLTIDICVSDADTGGMQPAGDVVQIVVSDDGPGIPAEIQAKIFDPFFSGREAGRGLGFGLSKCWRIIALHGGRIDVNSLPGQGTTFTLILPLSNEKSAVSTASHAIGTA
jgi:signal transduction histidine kinase